MKQRLYRKYNVTKLYGPTDPNAQYFILRVDTDPAARVAVLAYAAAVKEAEPLFAEQLEEWMAKLKEIVA